jgi:hypothetical protein
MYVCTRMCVCECVYMYIYNVQVYIFHVGPVCSYIGPVYLYIGLGEDFGIRV